MEDARKLAAEALAQSLQRQPELEVESVLESFDVIHQQTGLLRYFDFVLTAADFTRVKPDPELYAAALDALGARPRAAMAIEDSPNGVTAAKSAGLFCVAVPNTMTRNLPLDHADLLLDSLADVTLGILISAATASRP